MTPSSIMRALRVARRLVTLGALPGVLVYASMFALSVGFHASAEYMGVEDKTVSDRVMALFHDQIIAQQLGVLAWYLALGAGLGLMMLGAVRARDAVFGKPRRGWSTFAAVAGAVLVQHLALLVASMRKCMSN